MIPALTGAAKKRRRVRKEPRIVSNETLEKKGQNSKIFHVKMLNNEEIVPFPHYLVVHYCNANDFELGEILTVHY